MKRRGRRVRSVSRFRFRVLCCFLAHISLVALSLLLPRLSRCHRGHHQLQLFHMREQSRKSLVPPPRPFGSFPILVLAALVRHDHPRPLQRPPDGVAPAATDEARRRDVRRIETTRHQVPRVLGKALPRRRPSDEQRARARPPGLPSSTGCHDAQGPRPPKPLPPSPRNLGLAGASALPERSVGVPRALGIRTAGFTEACEANSPRRGRSCTYADERPRRARGKNRGLVAERPTSAKNRKRTGACATKTPQRFNGLVKKKKCDFRTCIATRAQAQAHSARRDGEAIAGGTSGPPPRTAATARARARSGQARPGRAGLGGARASAAFRGSQMHARSRPRGRPIGLVSPCLSALDRRGRVRAAHGWRARALGRVSCRRGTRGRGSRRGPGAAEAVRAARVGGGGAWRKDGGRPRSREEGERGVASCIGNRESRWETWKARERG